jgi:hypothetical protein
MAIGKSNHSTKDVIDAWKELRAKEVLEKYWSEKASADSEFTQADAIEQVVYDVERHESALRRIAAEPARASEIAKATLAYKRPKWS